METDNLQICMDASMFYKGDLSTHFYLELNYFLTSFPECMFSMHLKVLPAE